jgi:hypothetical protein
MNRRSQLSRGRITETHTSAIVVARTASEARTTSEARSTEPNSASAAGNSASEVPAASTKTDTTEASATAAVASCPSGMSQRDRCDAD